MSDAEVGGARPSSSSDQPPHALVVVEHDMSFIRMIAKKVTVLHQGRWS